jgi:hypothetical protein
MFLNLDSHLIDFPCPACSYGIAIQLVDARTQVWRWCPCCRSHVRIIEDGSVSVGIDTAEQALRELQKTMEDLFR